ncbi:unnamed protein product [Thelazia callipaeda]|uniref:RNA-binding protein 34 n=1 Tax=Thelazia callipaeda TaxID=103827 RepID=A0A0N5CKX3_THECL|nr:unnamed protein product [Thelazia callipaeda]
MFSELTYVPGALSDVLAVDKCSAVETVKLQKRNEVKFQNDGDAVYREIVDKNDRTVFVGNAPLSSTRKEIKKLFSQFGAVESVRLRSVIAASEKISKKVAVLRREISSEMKSLTFYVKFKDPNAIERALIMYCGNLLRVDRCCGKRTYSSQTTVFVGNLPYDVSENELVAHFEMTGNVSFVRIVRDRKTGISKGFAFVAFKESSSIPLALRLDGSNFKNRSLRVTRVLKKNKIRGKNCQRLRTGAKLHDGRMKSDRCNENRARRFHRKGRGRRLKNTVMT